METPPSPLEKSIKTIVDEIKQLRNIDMYISIGATVIVSILSFSGIADSKSLMGVFFGVLALFMSSLLGFKRKVNSLEKSNESIIPLTQELNKRLSYGDDISYVKIKHNFPDITNELKSATSLRILSASLTSTATKYYDSFLSVLNKGGEVKILTCEPSEKVSSMQVLRTHMIKDASKLSNQIKHSLEHLEGLKKFCVGEQCCIIKTIPIIIPYGIIVIENESESMIYVKIMPYQTPGSEYPYFIVRLSENPEMYNFYLEQFDKMFENSTIY